MQSESHEMIHVARTKGKEDKVLTQGRGDVQDIGCLGCLASAVEKIILLGTCP